VFPEYNDSLLTTYWQCFNHTLAELTNCTWSNSFSFESI